MSKFDLTVPVLHPNGDTFKNGDKDFTVKDAIMMGLSSPEEKITGDVKARRYEIALKVVSFEKDCELKSEEIVEIKKTLESTASTFVYGFINKYLG